MYSEDRFSAMQYYERRALVSNPVYVSSSTISGYGIVFDAQFINNCALTHVLMQFCPKREQTFTISTKSKFSASVFEVQRLEQTDFAVVHDSPSIGRGQSVALFGKLEDGESSGIILSRRTAVKQVAWQLLSKNLFAFYSCGAILTRASRLTMAG